MKRGTTMSLGDPWWVSGCRRRRRAKLTSNHHHPWAAWQKEHSVVCRSLHKRVSPYEEEGECSITWSQYPLSPIFV